MMKVCKECGVNKPLEDYHNEKLNKDGKKGKCKVCKCLQATEINRTKDGVVTKIYGAQVRNSKKRNHPAPTYTKQELKDWLFSQEKFHTMFDNWKRLDYQSEYKPSVDRKDDYIGYTIANIQLMSWGENNSKGHKDRRDGVNTKVNKAVMQFTKDGKYIATYYSVREADRQTGVDRGNIASCCTGKGKVKSAGGCIWKYVELKGESYE